MGINDYDKEAAFSSLHKMTNLNYTFDINNYPAIVQMSNVSSDNTTQIVNSVFTPINSFWASSAVLGSWFYVFLIIVTVGITYVKSQNVFRTSIVMLLMSLLASAPGGSGLLYIPSSALYVLYLFSGFGLLGVLYSFWVGE